MQAFFFIMTDDKFVVTGLRPSSALSSNQPHSAVSKHGYNILATKSSVDELLFRSHHSARLNEPIGNFKAPWEYPKPEPPSHTFGITKHKVELKPKPRGHPLLWCPTPGTAIYTRKKVKTNSSLDDSCYLWSTRDHFRHLKHTPSFVDETLFGQRLKEPSFEAPWNVKKNVGKTPSQLVDYHTVGNNEASSNTAVQTGSARDLDTFWRRPATALGIYTIKKKISYETTHTKPVWKP